MSGADQDAAFCTDLVRSHDFERYASTLFVDAGRRRALLALYAFNVEIVRVRDQVSQPLPGEIRLQWWTDTLEGAGHGGVEGNPVAAELLRATAAYALPVEPLTRLIDARQFDLYNDPMPTMAALEVYLEDTEAGLFGLAARILGAPSDAFSHAAHHAGLASGLTRVIATLPHDAARRQLLLPLAILEQHGGKLEDVFAMKPTPALRAAIDQVIGDARGHLATARSLLPQIPPQSRPAFLPLARVGRDLDCLACADRNPFTPTAVSRLRTLWTLWRASRSEAFSAPQGPTQKTSS